MSNYTPGPWIFTNGESPVDHKTYKLPGYYENLSLVGRDGTTVCGCNEYNIFHGSVGDRCLIAAAPELLEALKDALSRLKDWIGSDCECDNTHEANGTTCCLCGYRAAIAKAEGR